jgi:hypothetical protein
VHKAANGIKVETGADILAGDALLAYTKLNVEHSLGKFESKVKTDNCGEIKVETKKLLPGLNLIMSANQKPQYKGEIQYGKDAINAALSYTSCNGANKINANGVFAATKAVNVGASVDFDVNASQVGAVQAAANMARAKGSFGLKYNTNRATSKSCMSLGYVHQCCSRTSVAGRVCYNITTAEPCFALAARMKMNADTTYKMRATSKGNVGVSLEQQLVSPALKMNINGMSNVFDAGAGAKYGFGFTFGDY